MSTAAVKRYSSAEYLAFERASDVRHEYFNGEIFAMSGGRAPHSRIAANVIRGLGNALADGPCMVHTSDLRLYCPSGLYTYPDVSVVCDKPKYQDAKQDVLLNPIVIIEVLSPTTESYDRGDKFRHYRSIPSLKEFVLISQTSRRIEHFARQQDADHWLLTTVSDLQGRVEFPALGCSIPVSEIYAKIEFAGDAESGDRGNGAAVQIPQV